MRTNWTWMTGMILGCLCLALPAPAQDQEDYDEPDEPQVEAEEVSDEDESPPADIEVRKPREEQRHRKDRATNPKTHNLDRLEEQMKRELDLDQGQTEEIERLFEERRETFAQELAGQKDRMQEQRENMTRLLEQIREARQSGDSDLEKEVSMNIRAMHEAVRVEQLSEDFIARLEEELHDEQIEPFRKMVARGKPGSRLLEAARQRPGLLRRYLLRIDLDQDTQDEIEQLYEEVREDMRSGRLTHQEREERAGEFYEQALELLSAEEKALLMKHLGGDAKRSAPARDRSPRRHYDPDRDDDQGADEPEDEEAEPTDKEIHQQEEIDAAEEESDS